MSVAVNSLTVPILQAGSDEASAAQLAASTVNASYYNAGLATTFVKVFDTQPDAQVVGTFPTV